MSRHHGRTGRPVFDSLLKGTEVAAALPRWVPDTDPWLEIGEVVVMKDTGECEVLGSVRGGDKIALKDPSGKQIQLTRAQFQAGWRTTIRAYAGRPAS